MNPGIVYFCSSTCWSYFLILWALMCFVHIQASRTDDLNAKATSAGLSLPERSNSPTPGVSIIILLVWYLYVSYSIIYWQNTANYNVPLYPQGAVMGSKERSGVTGRRSRRLGIFTARWGSRWGRLSPSSAPIPRSARSCFNMRCRRWRIWQTWLGKPAWATRNKESISKSAWWLESTYADCYHYFMTISCRISHWKLIAKWLVTKMWMNARRITSTDLSGWVKSRGVRRARPKNL